MNNPVHGLTLTDQLEKHREEIVYGIKQAVGVGLSVGDNYTTMAKRFQTALIGPDGADGSYAKSVRETGNLDAARNLAEKLENAGDTMTKTWHTMKDERVRPQKRYKTKSGWKTGKPGIYNHVKMDGVTMPINEKFKLPSGAETMAPGQSGVAGEDINCRCYLSYEVMPDFDNWAKKNNGVLEANGMKMASAKVSTCWTGNIQQTLLMRGIIRTMERNCLATLLLSSI